MYIRKGRKQVDIRELLDICIDKNLIDITISSRKSKDDSRVQKVKIRPVIIKDSIEFQVSEFVGKKVLHTNLSADDGYSSQTIGRTAPYQ